MKRERESQDEDSENKRNGCKSINRRKKSAYRQTIGKYTGAKRKRSLVIGDGDGEND